MSLRITRRPRAREDLLEVWSYIADDNETAADRMLDRIEQKLLMLADNPRAGRERPEVAGGLRSVPVGNYVIFYRIEPDAIIVVRVLSGYKDTDAIEFG
ncbi:type II toxin-antitoxin system RelE/ParE family toxin [Jiella sonneratiae]|uniref:Type II toxin-antitoxin system RelE/ParE family toxin n=1 Tax=Jiella sonneratiae TaxID=2816856 RepID=A0ABS3JA42_9HYPH|nr:type II toxin-antitoxin system RelE/ParE family toxin [Jiella sonneratiae]MBO0906546.1 type II toxin-antitoxin system RelE/ParE family toxin [Jiella sonneratiae]